MEMNEQDELLKDVINNINKTNHELNRLKILLKEDKRQLRHKNIIISFLIVIIIGLSILNGYLLIHNKNETLTITRGHYNDSAIVTNNKLDNDSEININQKE